MRPSEIKILDLVTTWGPITSATLEEMSSYCRRTIRYALRKFVKEGQIERRVSVRDPRQFIYSSCAEKRAC